MEPSQPKQTYAELLSHSISIDITYYDIDEQNGNQFTFRILKPETVPIRENTTHICCLSHGEELA